MSLIGEFYLCLQNIPYQGRVGTIHHKLYPLLEKIIINSGCLPFQAQQPFTPGLFCKTA